MTGFQRPKAEGSKSGWAAHLLPFDRDGERAAGHMRRVHLRATCNGQRATGNGPRATGNGQRATGEPPATDRATGQHFGIKFPGKSFEIGGALHPRNRLEPQVGGATVGEKVQRRTKEDKGQRATGNGPQEADNGQRATDKRQRTRDRGQRTTDK